MAAADQTIPHHVSRRSANIFRSADYAVLQMAFRATLDSDRFGTNSPKGCLVKFSTQRMHRAKADACRRSRISALLWLTMVCWWATKLYLVASLCSLLSIPLRPVLSRSYRDTLWSFDHLVTTRVSRDFHLLPLPMKIFPETPEDTPAAKHRRDAGKHDQRAILRCIGSGTWSFTSSRRFHQ